MNKVSLLIFSAIAIIYLVVAYQYRWTGEDGQKYKTIISSDGRGHYDYLPHFFIYGYGANREFDNTIHIRHGKHFANKYYAGTAISQLPFFTLAWLYCKVSGHELTGFSPPFQIAVSLAALFYFFAALYFLYKILVWHFKLRQLTVALTLLVFSFGSSVFYYTLISPSFSHVITFFWVAFFFWQVSKISRGRYSLWTFIFCLFALSMILVIRPVNILVVFFIPVFFDSWPGMKSCFASNFKYNRKYIFIGAGVALLPVLTQCLAWYAQCGSFVIWSYKHEGFNWTNPHAVDFLFSYRKGLFVYAPLLLLALGGFYFLFKSNRWRFAWTLGTLAVIVYVLSSWWCWHYAGGFGMRPMTDFLFIFILLFALMVHYVHRVIIKFVLGLLVVFTIFINLVFSYQFYTDILNPFSMDKEKFWSVFLKTGKEYRNCFGGMKDEPPYAPNGFDTLVVKQFAFDNEPGGVLNIKNRDFPCEMVGGVNGGNHYSHYFKITLRRKIHRAGAGDAVSIVISTRNGWGIQPYTHYVLVKESCAEKAGEWVRSTYTVSCFNEEIRHNNFWIFFFNPKKQQMSIDDIRVEVLGVK